MTEDTTLQCRHCNTLWDEDGWEYCPVCRRNYSGARYPATQTKAELRDIESLIDQIRKAFDRVKLGQGLTIHQALFEGIYGPEDPQWQIAKEKDGESHWSEVPDSKLESGGSALNFFDPEGWRFYIPAFMSWTLRNWRTTDSLTPDSVLSNLTLFALDTKQYQSLDHTQSEVVYRFLAFFDHYSNEHDAKEAIGLYWHQFRLE